ncbi:hypothetical protein HRbin30_01670 [bacterium HR30]|nr:hypothetical protein HRbin30_01670 [bacterium HR30]
MGWERTLVFVAGASPQVITETVWALCQRRPVPRTKIFVLTTTSGRDHIERALLSRGGAWAALRREYPAARQFDFGAKQVLLLPGPNQHPLEDVRSDADSVAAGNFILDFVRSYTAPGYPPLHASIAGGRKTMGYLLGTAMMLYGRVDDRLSHVLVRPAALEGTDFFFPPRKRQLVQVVAPSGTAVEVPVKDISIDLAELPFPRLRLLQETGELPSGNFSELVQRLQHRLGQYVRPNIQIDVTQQRLICGGEAIRVSPLRIGIYAILAKRRRTHPAGTTCQGCSLCFLPASEIPGAFRAELSGLMRHMKSVAVGKDWGERNFRPEVSKLNAQLQQKLGSASAPYEVQIRGQKGQRLYGISASPELLTILGLPTVGGNVAKKEGAIV